MSLARFLDRVEATPRTLVVANRSGPVPVRTALEDTFKRQPVRITERDVPGVERDTVLLVEDGEVVATSPLSALRDAIVMVNSDLYRTGARGLAEVDLPAVIRRLHDVRFSLRGYPKSNTEKLILVVISRYIERIAARAGRGRHRASFQSLSRINDERGTRAVYERLADTDLDVHVYGRPDWIPSRELDVTTHAGDGPDFRDSWFVLYTPDAEPSDSDATADPAPNPNTDDTPSPHPVALLAIETEPREWEAFWTFDPSLVADLNASIRRRL